MNYGLCLPTGTIFKDNENVCSCDLISYDDFIKEVNWLINHCKFKKGLYTYYEGKIKIYEVEIE